MEKSQGDRPSFSDDEEAAYSFLRKMLGEEPQSEGPRLVQPPPPPLSLEGRARLPETFHSRGLMKLLSEEWGEAAAFYKACLEEEPEEAAPYLGLGAALVGTNDVKRAAAFLEQGVELEPDFPVGTLVAEITRTRPERLLTLARLLIRRRSAPALDAARSVIDAYLLMPTTPQSSYVTAHALRVQAETSLERTLRETDSRLQESAARYSERVMFRSTRRMGVLLAGLLIVASLVPDLVIWGRGAWLLHVGTTEYVATVRLQTNSDASLSLDGRSLYQRYLEAYGWLSEAADLRPTSLDAQYTALLAGTRLLSRGEGEVPAHVQRRLALELKTLQARIDALDPGGGERKAVDARLARLVES